MLTAIAAMAENKALGKDNQLLWHLPNDFKHFKNSTLGHPIIMGRKTFDSFPAPLPNREHIVITRNKTKTLEGCTVVHSLEEALKLVENRDAFIIGGGEIYKQALPHCDRLSLTVVHHSFEDADTFFPEWINAEWNLIETEFHPADARHAFDFEIRLYERKK